MVCSQVQITVTVIGLGIVHPKNGIVALITFSTDKHCSPNKVFSYNKYLP